MTDTLGITYAELRRRVGRHLGFDRDPANWGERETLDVQDIIDSGVRAFHRPPRIAGEAMSYQWSFLRPQGFITLGVGTEDHDMPGDFAGFDGPLYHVSTNELHHSVRLVNEGQILNLRQRDSLQFHSDSIEFAALTPKRIDGISQGTWQLMVWPKPDHVVTLTFKYFVRPQVLRNDNDVPYGASEHAETIIASCLAMAERMLDDHRGTQWELYQELLVSSKDFDARATSPMTLGYNGDGHACECECDGGHYRSIGGLIDYVQPEEEEDDDDDGGIPSFPVPPPEGEGLITHEDDLLIITHGDDPAIIAPHDP